MATARDSSGGVRWLGLDCEEAIINKAREHCAGIKNIALAVDV